MKSVLCKPTAITITTIILLTSLSIATPICLAQNYNTSYQLLDKPGGNVAYTLNIAVPKNLLDYYQGQSNKLPSTLTFPKFVTPYAVKPIADTLQTIYQDEENFANAVLSIVHQMNYMETTLGKYPVETIVDNTGDCDIFSFVAASILEAKGIDTLLLYYEDQSHMNIGVHLDSPPENARGNTYSVKHDNIVYYIAECTGGNLTYGWRVGECPDSLKDVKAQILTLENAEEIAPGQVSASFTTLEPSEISLEISPAIAFEDGVITFQGYIIPSIPYQNVTIYLGISGYPWKVLGTTATLADGSFVYTWKTTLNGFYAVRASWNGDEIYSGSVSMTQNGTVIPIILTALIGLAILSTALGVLAILLMRRMGNKNPELREPHSSTFS